MGGKGQAGIKKTQRPADSLSFIFLMKMTTLNPPLDIFPTISFPQNNIRFNDVVEPSSTPGRVYPVPPRIIKMKLILWKLWEKGGLTKCPEVERKMNYNR